MTLRQNAERAKRLSQLAIGLHQIASHIGSDNLASPPKSYVLVLESESGGYEVLGNGVLARMSLHKAAGAVLKAAANADAARKPRDARSALKLFK